MLTGWTAWPRGVRWTIGGIAALLLILVVAWALFVPVADLLARHDVGSSTGTLHETALDNARGRLLTLGAGLLAAGALAFTARTFYLSREGQVTDRYTKAIEQLGSDKLDVRIGGIYALERIARDSARDHPTAMEVLTTFVRAHSREPLLIPMSAGYVTYEHTRPDVQAALTVVGRRDAKRDIQRIDLMCAHLPYASLTSANLAGAYLSAANLTHALLDGACLADAKLADAKLADTVFTSADLSGAYLSGAHLARAYLVGTTLNGADLIHADLRGAFLGGGHLAKADLTGANLAEADLRGADLTGATLAGANLTHTRWPEDAPVPRGWKRDAESGRLQRAATDSGLTEAD